MRTTIIVVAAGTCTAHGQVGHVPVARATPTPPTTIAGDPPQGVAVFSNVVDDIQYFAGANPGREYGDDLHLIRPGMLTWLQFAYSDLAGSATIRFYANDPNDGGIVVGDEVWPLPNLLATLLAEDLPAAAGPEGEGLTGFVRFGFDVDPPILLPQDVWITVSYSNFPAYTWARGVSIGSSHALSYSNGWIEDFGEFNHVLELRMEPSPADTPVGADVVVQPEPNVTVTFANVTQAGATQVTTSATNPFPDASFEFLGVFYDIDTNALFSGTAEVCLPYDDTGLSLAQEEALQLLHYENGAWVDITTSVDTANNVVCGETASFSPFAIGHTQPHPAQSLIDDLLAEIELLNIKHGVANSLDAKLETAKKALEDFNDMNEQAAANSLAAFINEVQAQSGGALSEQEAFDLCVLATQILQLL